VCRIVVGHGRWRVALFTCPSKAIAASVVFEKKRRTDPCSALPAPIIENEYPAIGKSQTYPICLEGERACPPEDCGGPWGFVGFLEAISDPQYEQHAESPEWVGGEFDPEEFDLNAVNGEMRGVMRRS
jgi:hypothetical protein